MADIESLKTYNFLGTQELERATRNILDLNSYWEQRKPDWPLFTLGKSLYRDANEKGFAGYVDDSGSCNSVLYSQLFWLYDKLKCKLEEELGTEVVYHSKLALPGFHIMLADERFAENFADIHIDTQYQQIDFASLSLKRPEAFNKESVFSVTIPIQQPQKGAALNHWPVTKEMADEYPREKTAELLKYENASRLEYHLGNIYLHSGLEFHQIAPWRETVDNERRITLQAHGIKIDEKWLLFW